MSTLKSYFRTFPFQIEDFSEVQKAFYDEFSKLSYKNGTLFTVNPGENKNIVTFQACLEVDLLEVEKLVQSGEKRKIRICGRKLSLDLSKIQKSDILHEIFELIMELEKHEAEEWFKFNSKHVINPHPTHE
jgi:hypothetical protein